MIIKPMFLPQNTKNCFTNAFLTNFGRKIYDTACLKIIPFVLCVVCVLCLHVINVSLCFRYYVVSVRLPALLSEVKSCTFFVFINHPGQ